MNHKECRKLFPEVLYQELDDETRRAEFNTHLESCPECRSSFEELRAVVETMRLRQRTDLSKAEWTAFWNELEPALKSGNEEQRVFPLVPEALRRFFRHRPAWAFSAAGIAILAIGIFIGQLFVSQRIEPGSIVTGISESERILLNERALNYLERSKVLLLGIVNKSSMEPTSESLAKEQSLSRTLVREASSLKSDLSQADEQRMKQLIGDLEVILLQIANLEEQKDFPALEIVQGGVERTGILLKINLEQMRSQQNAPAPEPESRSTESSI